VNAAVALAPARPSRVSLLFIRSVPVPVAQAALATIRRSYPSAEITVLAGRASVTAMESLGVADRVVPYGPSRFGLLAAGPGIVARLRRHRFDAVIVPFAGSSREASWNVARLAAALGAPVALWLSCDRVADRVSLEACDRVSIREWLQRSLASAGLRQALLAAIRPPALCAFSAVAVVLLGALAFVLLPLVWLKPAPSDDGR
jgi:hypothetical protein